jgi:uncharacterized protein
MLVEAEVWTVARTEQGNAVLIRPRGGDMAVPIFIGPLEAQSILIGMGDVPMPRPLTHDLFLSVLHTLEVRVERVEITELKEGTFYARLLLGTKNDQYSIDARPSDSIALAVRNKCPVFIDESIIDEAAISVDVINEQTKQNEQIQRESEKDVLEKELQKAVEEENYEEAARLRDKLQDMTDTGGPEEGEEPPEFPKT